MFGHAFQTWHLLILIAVLVVLFGSKRLPDAARGLGRSLRIFKAEVREMQEEDARRPATPAAPLEGRVVDAERPAGSTTPAAGETRNDA